MFAFQKRRKAIIETRQQGRQALAACSLSMVRIKQGGTAYIQQHPYQAIGLACMGGGLYKYAKHPQLRGTISRLWPIVREGLSQHLPMQRQTSQEPSKKRSEHHE
ncbi:hypothetical protein [Marinomonas sp.]